jgi:23S rRNA (cytosine1962-C5)-methyltransferase
MQPAVFAPCAFPDYALLDSGAGEKLERFGEFRLARPDPQALWPKRLDARAWTEADLVFVRESDRGGRWEGSALARLGEGWRLAFERARFWVKPTPFKHVGVFPEQATNWRWMEERLQASGPGARVLNLFGYTGVASLLARFAEAEVTHVDASRLALDWARRNAEESGLGSAGLRWVLEDALAFARREARRGARYTGILLDPPHHGRGPKGETWQLETGLAPLLEACARLLAERSFLVLSTYAVGYTALSFWNLLAAFEGGTVEAGELVLPEDGAGGRRLPCGFSARWSRDL